MPARPGTRGWSGVPKRNSSVSTMSCRCWTAQIDLGRQLLLLEVHAVDGELRLARSAAYHRHEEDRPGSFLRGADQWQNGVPHHGIIADGHPGSPLMNRRTIPP